MGCNKMSRRPPIRIKYENVPSFHITGVFGGLDPVEGRIAFFNVRLIPQEGDQPGSLQTGEVHQEYVAEVKMSPMAFKSIANWMNRKLTQYEERFGEITGESPEERESGVGYT